MKKQILMTAVAVAASASLATAQFGRETLSIDLEAQTGLNNLHLGCAYGLTNTNIYTSGRGLGAATVGPHSIYQYDAAGTLVSTMAQPAASNATVWGYRDGASSIVGQVFFGWDGGIDAYDVDPATGALIPATTLIAAAGATTLTPLAPGEPGTITNATIAGTHRAVAFNFFGNAGQGSFFIANFGSAIFEIDTAGNVLHTFPNSSSVIWSAYGLAIDDKGDGDETNDTLWVNASPNAGPLVEYSIDRTTDTLTPTGLSITRNQPTSAQGGLALVPGGLDGRNCGYDLIGVDQGTPDTLTGYRVVQWDGMNPATEPQMLVGADGGALVAGNVEVDGTMTSLEFDVASPGTAGLPYLLFFDLVGGVKRTPGPLPVVGDVAWELSHPRATGLLVASYTAGTPVSFSNFLAGQPVGTGVEWQAFALDILSPATACGKNLTFLGLPWSTSTFGTHTRVIDPLVCLTTEDFEGTINGVGNYPLGWADGGGTAQWSSNSGGTTSGATGPTAAVSGSQYMYCETSVPNTTATFIMNTRVYTPAELAGAQIGFQLSRVGASIGSLDVFMDDGINPPVLLGNFTGASANEWDLEVLNLPSIPAGGASFTFTYTAGGTFTGDIAIDDFCTL